METKPIKDKDIIDKFMKLIVKRNNVNLIPVEHNILGPLWILYLILEEY